MAKSDRRFEDLNLSGNPWRWIRGDPCRGAWRYLEHDWVSRTGDIVHETPGSVHTLVLQEESEIIFFVEGALEFLDSQGQTLAHEDWRSISQKYVDFCTERELDIVDIARPRTLSRDRFAVA